MERWPIYMIEGLLPLDYEIIYEINRRHLELTRPCPTGELAHHGATHGQPGHYC